MSHCHVTHSTWDVVGTILFQLQVIARVDGIYRRHQFEGCDKGFGFEIQKVCIKIANESDTLIIFLQFYCTNGCLICKECTMV